MKLQENMKLQGKVFLTGAALFGAVVAVAASASVTTRDDYLDVMEAAVQAYSDARLAQLADEADRRGVQEHGFPRLAANMGVLIANGRLLDRKALFVRLMTTACRDAVKGKMPCGGAGNEFSVKELVWTVEAVEKAGVCPAATTAAWRVMLARIDGRESYAFGRLRVGEDCARNWVVFACASEQARLAAGVGGDPAFVETYVADQLRWFDELGMYRDPSAPIVYDLVTRLQFMCVLAAGYDGPSRTRLERLLDTAAEPTLRMLSAVGEIPFGGRSNQFLHNHTVYAAVCEWYAMRAVSRGDLVQANLFKRAARRALDALRPWLEATPVRHVKNRYPRLAGDGGPGSVEVGCEGYAYFDKYMITMGSWAMAAYRFCRDVSPVEVPSEQPFAFATTPDFHQVLLSSGDYSAQFDWCANAAYDATGLGRVQRRGAPGAICLASPCPAQANYRRACEGPALAIRPVCPTDAPLALSKRYATASGASVEWTAGDLTWSCTLNGEGLCSELRGPGTLALALPALEFDGAQETDVRCTESSLAVAFGGWVCRFTAADGQIVRTDDVTSNRNGRYRRYEARGDRRLRVMVTITPTCPASAGKSASSPSTPEAELAARLPEAFAKSAAHYRALDTAATPLMRDEKGRLRVPHGWKKWKTGRDELDMRSVFWWTAGHFPGSLWYLYEATGEAFFRERATAWTEILAPNAQVTGNHDIGFIMYCSYGNARRLLKTDDYDALLLKTAASLAQRFDEGLGLIRSWGARDAKENFLVIPDNLMNLELLEWAAGQQGGERYGRIAASHADVTMRNHFRDDGGAYHVLDYDQRPGFLGTVQNVQRGQGRSCRTTWSRGQSWAIYGYTMMYRVTKNPTYLAFAQKVSDYAINHPNMPADGIPYWDYGAPGEERDSSAGAVMASALLELADFVGGAKGAAYRAFAVKQLLALASPAYFSEGDEIGHWLLKHGVGHKPGDSEIDTPLSYGDYYFLEALLRFRASVSM